MAWMSEVIWDSSLTDGEQNMDDITVLLSGWEQISFANVFKIEKYLVQFILCSPKSQI